MQTRWTYVDANTNEVSRDFDTVESWPLGRNEIQWEVVNPEDLISVFFRDDFESAQRFLLSDEAREFGFAELRGIRRDLLGG